MAHFELEYDCMHLHQALPASSGQSLRRHDLLNFIATLYQGDLHAKRVLSLANATLGVLTSASLAIHAVGRGLAQALGTLTKHGVKQVDRLLSNRGVDVWSFFAYWTPFIVGARTEVVVALDWTSFAADGQDLRDPLILPYEINKRKPFLNRRLTLEEFARWRTLN